MKEKKFLNANTLEQDKYRTIHTPVIEMENDDFIHTLNSKWFSEEFYNLLCKHNFNVILKNNNTGQMAFIRTFGVRFPVLISDVA